MANTPQARKRARQNHARRLHNRSRTTMMRSAMKKVLRALRTGDLDKAKEVYRKEAVPAIDRNAKSGVIHANKAARHKSRLNHHLRKAAGA